MLVTYSPLWFVVQVLELGTLPRLTPRALEAIASSCTGLTRVALHDLDITHEHVNLLSQKCSRLEQIDLYDQETGIDPTKLIVGSRILAIVLPFSEGGGMLTSLGVSRDADGAGSPAHD